MTPNFIPIAVVIRRVRKPTRPGRGPYKLTINDLAVWLISYNIKCIFMIFFMIIAILMRSVLKDPADTQHTYIHKEVSIYMQLMKSFRRSMRYLSAFYYKLFIKDVGLSQF